MDWQIWYKHKYYQTVNCEISDVLEEKYKQNTNSLAYIETWWFCHDLKENDDEETESVEVETCQYHNSLAASHAMSSILISKDFCQSRIIKTSYL